MAAICLIVGFWKLNISLVSAGALVVVMAGAVVTHLNAGQGMGTAMTPLILMVLSLIVFLGRRSFINTNTSVNG